jgi:tetratricopeptide (TPR) repeat protein
MMRKHTAITAALFALALTAGAEDKKEPFYRPYLIPGNRLDDKIRAQEQRVEADPKSPALRNDFGNLLAARRFVGDARKQYKEAMKLDNKNYLAAYNLGLLEETEGRAGAAISAFRESISRKPGFPPSRFHLGRLYEKSGSTERAIEQYARALRIDPSMRDPRRNPLVGDTRLLDRVSLTNYERDLATASIATEARYSDEGRFANVPVDRALSSEDVAEPASPAPANVPGAWTPSASASPTVRPAGAAPLVPGPAPTQTPAPMRAPLPGATRPKPPAN